MYPVKPTTKPDMFRYFVKKKNNDNDQEKNFEEKRARLHQRLKNIRDGFEIKPMTGKNSFSLEDIEVLNDNISKQKRYGATCPECQDTYKKNSMRQRELTLYRDANQRVEISS